MIRRCAIALWLLLSAPALAGDWTLVGERDGVTTWSQNAPDGKLLGFRGRSVVDLPRPLLLRTLLDPDRAREWVDLLVEQRVVERGPQREVIYQRYDMAWPVADRDLVLERVVREPAEGGRTTITIRSITHPAAPPVEGVVRAEVLRSGFTLTDLPDGRTRIEVEAFTDPKGIVPPWLVNLVQKTWVRNSITALARCARSSRE